ncbi:hypothetical protein L6467_05825 [Segatella bryantii]|jgi:hypothetical protein|uniref:hypothetical protein n=1 Tax=Segatella bryantii TaxID=77095 RepID=UPI001EDA8A45|nr:hypothetical protein [Segatella bryantii]UKK73926.1 hypothetical protein L6467_05825 [Segatella bryantii]
MSKNKDQKRKVQLATRAKNESFRFQVEFTRKQKCIDIMGMEQNLTTELDAICQNNLTDALLDLAKIVEGVRKELGFEQEADKCSLNGSLVPFILGITTVQPDSTTYVPGLFTAQHPLQVTIAFDNEIRNQAVKWMEANGYEISSYLGQPLLKLKNARIVIRRVVRS